MHRVVIRDEIVNSMAIDRSQARPRISLLRRSGSTDIDWHLPLWKVVLVTNGLIITLNGLVLLVGTGSLANLPEAAVIVVTFSTAITLLAALSARLSANVKSGTLRVPLIVLGWIVSGIGGSMIAVLILRDVLRLGLLDNLTLNASAWIGNGIVAVGVGAVLLALQLVRGHYRQRNVLLHQQALLTAEFAAARNVQMSLLPPEDLQLHGFDISGSTEPAVEIGGDYYDYLTFADGTKGILVADAAGKGVPAALLMAKFQGMAQSLSIHITSAMEFFLGLNDTLTVRMDRRSFITVGMVTIDFDDRCRFYRAGHNPLLIYRAATGTIETLRPPGMALGLSHGPLRNGGLVAADFEMAPGDVALLFSDGLTEATNAENDPFGDERAEAALLDAGTLGLGAEDTHRAVTERLARHVNGAAPHDDITLVVIRKL